MYALIGKRPAKPDPLSLLSAATADDLKPAHFPWIPIGGSFVILVAGGLFFMRREAEAPLAELRAEVQRLAKGEIQKLQDVRYPGRFGGIARDVNAAIERHTHAPSRETEMGSKDLNAILDGGPRASRTTAPAVTPMPTFSPPPLPAFSLGGPPPPAFLPPPPSPSPPAAPVVGPPAPNLAPLAVAPRLASLPPPPRAPAAPMPSPPAAMALPAEAFVADAAAPPKAPPFKPFMESPRLVTMPALTPPAPLAEPAPAATPADPEEEHVRAVFADYLALKQQCGESVETLTLDKFRTKLKDNRAALMTKYNCRTVRFSVYQKDGKAALKATPVRD
jgi:hypothetical protein